VRRRSKLQLQLSRLRLYPRSCIGGASPALPTHFTQEDPIGLAGGLNLYGYSVGDPINNSDPFGLASCPPECEESEREQVPTSEEQAPEVQSCTADAATYLRLPGVSAGRRLVWEAGQASRSNPLNRHMTQQPWEYGVWADASNVFAGTLTTNQSSVRVSPSARPFGATSFIHSHGHASGRQSPSRQDVATALRDVSVDVVQSRDSAFLIVPGRGVFGCQMAPPSR
jgi:hypothetical protein